MKRPAARPAQPAFASAALRELNRLKDEYGDRATPRKLVLLRVLHRGRLRSANEVKQLHELLCVLRAYPDSAILLKRVEQMLAGFARRRDLRQHRATLASTGIAGTPTEFAFFAPTALWLARRWGTYLTLNWHAFAHADEIERLLPHLALYGETPGLDEFAFEPREWLRRMKSPRETDAAFLLRRIEQVPMTPFLREALVDELDLPLVLAPGPDTPARTLEKWPNSPVHWQSGPRFRGRPPMPDAIFESPRAVCRLTPREGQRFIDLCRAAMAVRSRDLDAFAYGEARDVAIVDCGDGLQFGYVGVIPERRLMLETTYGYLMLKNGVPVGYGTVTSLFRSAEVAYTVFDTFRGGEAALMFVKVLASARHLFGVDAFMIEPYQLGYENDDAIQSGAWWFYYKLGFRPRDAAARQVMRAEQRRLKARPSHRSSVATLRKLAAANVFVHLDKERDDVLGVLPLANVGLCVTEYLARHYGSDRTAATRECAAKAARLLGLRDRGGFSAGERLAWERWAPLVLALPGVNKWPNSDKRALAAIVRAKGGPRESEYVQKFDEHVRLRHALSTLAQ